MTRDGKPLVERRYYFSEAFAVMGYAEYYKATGLEEAKERAIKLYDKMVYYYTTPGVSLRKSIRIREKTAVTAS